MINFNIIKDLKSNFNNAITTLLLLWNNENSVCQNTNIKAIRKQFVNAVLLLITNIEQLCMIN